MPELRIQFCHLLRYELEQIIQALSIMGTMVVLTSEGAVRISSVNIYQGLRILSGTY